MLTRRQKNSIRGMTAALSCSALLAGFLIYTNISNVDTPEPVVFSDILEGAVAYYDDSDGVPAVTLASEQLMETMFSEQYAALVDPNDPAYSVTYVSPTYYQEPGAPDAAPDNDGTADRQAETDSISGIPDNANEMTLLSDELEQLRTEQQDNAPSTSYSGNAYIYINASDRTSASESPAAVTTADTASDTGAVSSSGGAPAATYQDPDATTATTVTTTSAASTTTSAAATSETTTSATTTATSQTTTTTSQTTTTASQTTTTTSRTTTAATTTTTTVTTSTTKATAAPANTSSGTSKTPFTNIGGGVVSKDDNIYITMLRLVNNARRQAGLNELWYSARIHEVCVLRTTELSSYYSHTRPDGTRFSTAFSEIGIKYQKCGENIAYGRNMFTTPEEVFKAWMESPSHYENIMSPDFECVAFGLSILKVGNDTYYYWAQEFAKF